MAGDGPDDVRAFVRAFWRELDSLRRERGMSYKQLERRTKIACSTLQYWMISSGRLLPWVQVRAVVLALEAPEELWFDRWKQADHRSALNGAAAINWGECDGDAPLSGAAVAARAQLPMDILEFTGREGELRQLREALSPDDGATAVAVSVITGMAGIGKTRLAVHVAHELRRWFRLDDVQLYADLRGHCPDGGPADPAVTLAAFLRLLGMPGGDLPGDVNARAALYRDRMDGKRAIVVLDDAADEQQVQPLLPGSPTCRVLVTSRRMLTGLDGVRPLTLGLFSLEEALTLLATVAGGERVLAERAAAEEILRLCGYLPLAVALAARRLQARPAWALADLAELLGVEAGRLDELAVRNRAVRTVFDLSYRQLGGERRRMFRLLGLHPGHDFTAHSAAALADLRPEQARALLESLLDEHLLDQAMCGRYRFHGLMRTYAGERAGGEEAADGGIEAVRRLLVWYLHTAESASWALAPGIRRFPLDSAGVPGRLVVQFSTCGQALAWFDAEHANLAAAVRVASGHRFDLVAWRLASALLGFFRLRKHWDEWIATFTVAVCAARRLEDAAGEARLLDGLGVAYCEVGRFPESLDCFQRALSLYRRSGDRIGESQVLNNLGEYHWHRGRFEEAADHYRQSTNICRELGIDDFTGVNNLGKELGDTSGLADTLERLDQD
jgi:tetratricopeptide (TPR) repeat protein/transcriptional regulator with XRE-family HTH domain